MKKVFLAIVFVSAFSLLFKGASNATSLETFLFTGHIYEGSNIDDPALPQIGDKFVGRLSYVYDPMLKPHPTDPDGIVFNPDNSFNFLFDDFNMTGSAVFTFGYESAGEDMLFWGFYAFGAPFYIEDIWITIGDTGGSVGILLAETGSSPWFHVYGTMDWVSYSSIPMNAQPAPEPASFILLGVGLLGYVGSKFRRKKEVIIFLRKITK